ncbi:GATA-4/5/6 transcription factor [Roridomyces roridus]|uniref:GATA-4/5/6 transcription factor n=1 Tax=Roridomyces roridus TaxID=1738132 RepID=A0AAD7CL21_9AGAR|nr:GATA-4/5/6 transcription factor [Roridomyces roridus]
MELIRTKRAATAVNAGAGGPPKSKYRKRSVSVFSFVLCLSDVGSRDWSGQRATPPGKCHSCNIRETPEWRRGPDGARTLCNACGLHYAKLMRKREKEQGQAGAPIDMDTLRASARADMAAKLAAKAGNRAAKNGTTAALPTPSDDIPPPPAPPATHQGSFQVTFAPPPPPPPPSSSSSSAPTGPALSPSEVQAQMHNPVPPPTLPPPPVSAAAWSASGQRTYAPEQLQHQSFVRTAGQTSSA